MGKFYFLIVDNVSINIFNGNFNIEKYNVFRRFQLRCKLFTTMRIKAAKVIHKGCHNWLYLGKCKDNTIGIVPRLEC